MTEFEKYARLDRGISPTTLGRYCGFTAINNDYISPTIVERER